MLAELKRRKVVRAGLVYGAAAFAVLQVGDIVIEPLGLPGWSMSALIRLVLLGFPVTMVIAWFVDLSREPAGPVRWISLRAAAAVVLLVAVGAAGDAARALEILASLAVEGWYELTFVSQYFSAAPERFALAELLFAAGRREEALAWYEGLRENAVPDLSLLRAGPPS